LTSRRSTRCFNTCRAPTLDRGPRHLRQARPLGSPTQPRHLPNHGQPGGQPGVDGP
jgi:hypothetical protein